MTGEEETKSHKILTSVKGHLSSCYAESRKKREMSSQEERILSKVYVTILSIQGFPPPVLLPNPFSFILLSFHSCSLREAIIKEGYNDKSTSSRYRLHRMMTGCTFAHEMTLQLMEGKERKNSITTPCCL